MGLRLALDTHKNLLQNLEKSIRELLTIKGKTRELRVLEVYLPKVLEHDDTDEQKKAKVFGLSYDSDLHAKLELYDNTTKKSVKSKVLILKVPQVTRRGTYIVGGNEYTFPFQKRLIPGAPR